MGLARTAHCPEDTADVINALGATYRAGKRLLFLGVSCIFMSATKGLTFFDLQGPVAARKWGCSISYLDPSIPTTLGYFELDIVNFTSSLGVMGWQATYR